MTNFYLVKITEGSEHPLPNFGPYPTGPTAAYWAKQAAKKTGEKVMPRRVSQAPDWRLRQKTRLENGELKPLPEQWDLAPIDGHFTHLAAANEFMIGYFANPAHAVMDKASEIKPGTYLKKFYPAMTENDRKRYAAIVDNSGDVFIGRTEDEMEFAYEQCPHTSCMTTAYQRSRGRSFSSPMHPIRVYAAGDLAIAYTKSKTGSVAERCLCWPDRKIYSRIYGDGSGRLGKLLMSKGMTSASIDDFNGAKLKRVLVGGSFVCPYIDANAGETPMVRDDGENLVIDTDEGTMTVTSTTGLIRAVIAKPKKQPDPPDLLAGRIDAVLAASPVAARPITLPPTDGPTIQDYLMVQQAITNNAEGRERIRIAATQYLNDNTIFELGELGS